MIEEFNGAASTTLTAPLREILAGFALNGSGSLVIDAPVGTRTNMVIDTPLDPGAHFVRLDVQAFTGGTDVNTHSSAYVTACGSNDGLSYVSFQVDTRNRWEIRSTLNNTDTILASNLSYVVPATPFELGIEVVPSGSGAIVYGTIDGLRLPGAEAVITDSILLSGTLAGIRGWRRQSGAAYQISRLSAGTMTANPPGGTTLDAPVVTLYEKWFNTATVDIGQVTGAVYYQALLNGVIVEDRVQDFSYIYTGLSQDTTYTLTIQAVSSSGSLSNQSTPLVVKTYKNTGRFIFINGRRYPLSSRVISS